MKEGSEGDGGGSDCVPTSRDADSTVSNGLRVGITPGALAVHEGLPLGGTTLANALLGIALDRGSANGANSSRNGGGVHTTKSLGVKGIGDNGQNRDKVFMCNICNRSFGYKHVLQNHERTHTGEKPFECKECHKKFTRDHHLKTHMRLHTGEKPYQCSHCERQFVQVANLRRHLRVHTGERPYACHICSSKFSDSNQLKAHLLIHEGIKPYDCLACKGKFRRRHHLVHHKCPMDEANLGKPKRGRRPKAYDELPTMLSQVKQELLSPRSVMPPPASVGLTSVIKRESTPPSQVAVSLASMIKQESPPQVGLASVIKREPSSSLMPQPAHMHQVRRNQHSLQYPIIGSYKGGSRYHDAVQTGPLDMTVTASSAPVSVITHAAFHMQAHNSVEGVLDLSNSKSDSEAEPIEEEVDEEDDCMDDGRDSESEEEGRQDPMNWAAYPWKRDDNQFDRFVMVKHLQHGNGDTYENEDENSNLYLQLTTS